MPVLQPLPVELWAQIFSWTDHGLYIIDWLYVIAPTYNMARVCSLWREIVNGMPRLWSSLSVSFDLEGRTGRNNLMPILDMYLKKSEGCTLHIGIFVEDACDDDQWPETPNPEMLAIIHLLLSHSSRCTSLDLDFRDEILMKMTEPPPNFSFPLLRSFTNRVHHLEVNNESHWFWKQILVVTTTTLHHLETEDAVWMYELLPDRTFHNLTSLTLDDSRDGDFPDFLLFLSAATNLRALEVTSIPFTPAAPRSFPEITLPFLRKLELDVTGTAYIHGEPPPSLFAHLKLPALKEVKVGFRETVSLHVFATFRDMLRRSQSPLEVLHLILEQLCIDAPTLLDLLRMMGPNLHSFRLRVDGSISEQTYQSGLDLSCRVLEELTLASSHCPLLPHLRNFTLSPSNKRCPLYETSLLPSQILELWLTMAESRSRRSLQASGFAKEVAPLESAGLFPDYIVTNWFSSLQKHEGDIGARIQRLEEDHLYCGFN